ncbi:hypothetical protein SLOPH_527 [Spraguea lophii 42_110]|uniref:Uncharacterized protein n=1 Tax=Spraguea lophii (strain 42_110) TaxID=1358809 RepID=S7W8L2_SPRLO|nr:hypothetical protein SLOPH_527 [Spraguea lophii 42_110]
MVNFLNLFIIFIILNYEGFIHNIGASNNNIPPKDTKHILTLENIQDEKYEINGQILYYSPNSISKEQYVKITEIEYDGIEIEFMDKNNLPIYIEEFEFHNILSGNLKRNDCDYYFRILSVILKVTIFIEERCFRTTLWHSTYISKPIKIYTSLQDQLLESICILDLSFSYQYVILPSNWFDNTTSSNLEYSENQNIYDVDILKVKKIDRFMYVLNNLKINKDSKTYNINYFRFDHVYSNLYTKIYYYGANGHAMIEGYTGKSTNRYNMNENILVSYTKTNKPQDMNNNNTIQYENNLENQSVPVNTSTISKISCNTQIDEVDNPNLDLINKCQNCQKNVESKEPQVKLGDLNTKDREQLKKRRETDESQIL